MAMSASVHGPSPVLAASLTAQVVQHSHLCFPSPESPASAGYGCLSSAGHARNSLVVSDSPVCQHTAISRLEEQGKEKKTWLYPRNVPLLPFCAAVQKHDRFCKSSVEGILKDQIMVMLLCFLGESGSAVCFLSNIILAL